jgi:hypothetical protein
MANNSNDYPTISESQASKATTANGLHLAASPAMLWGIDPPNTSALTLGLLEGVLNVAGTPTQIAATTVSLTGSATNYVEATTAGVVSSNTSAFTGGRLRLYTVVCGASSITSYTDHRYSGFAAGLSATPAADDVSITDAGGYFTGTDVEAALQELGATVGGAQPIVAGIFYPGSPTASALVGVFAAPSGITTITFAAAIAGSSGKALTAATAQTDIDVRKNATTSSGGSSVGTVRFAAAGTVPTFIAASGFTLTGGTDYLTFWAPASPDATLANFGFSLYGTR